MAVTFGFYNSINKDRAYNAVQISQLFDGLIRDGIYQNFPETDDHLAVRAGTGMQVIVQPGRAWFNHTWTLNDSDLLLPINGADYQAARIDAVVLKVDRTDPVRTNTIYVEAGAVSDHPEPPTFVDTDSIFYHVLAYVTVNAGVEQITDSNIEDRTGYRETGGGFVESLLETISVDELMHRWEVEWQEYTIRKRAECEAWIDETQAEYLEELDEWETANKQVFLEWMAEQTIEYDIWKNNKKYDFDEWFANLQYVLDGDVAGHLQDEIDELKEDYKNVFLYCNDMFDNDRTYETDKSGFITKITSVNASEKMKSVTTFSQTSETVDVVTQVINVYSDYEMEHLITRYTKTTTFDKDNHTINDSAVNIEHF